MELGNRAEVERRREEDHHILASEGCVERRTNAARLLSVSEATLYRKLKEYGQ